MPETTQSYSNHTRWHTPFHFVLTPILLIHLLWCIWQLYKTPNLEHAEALLLAFGLVLTALLTRINPLKAQDRLIRLEEQLRFQRLLPADLAAKAGALPEQFIVMRAGPDASSREFGSEGQSAGHCSADSSNPARWRIDLTTSTCAAVPV